MLWKRNTLTSLSVLLKIWNNSLQRIMITWIQVRHPNWMWKHLVWLQHLRSENVFEKRLKTTLRMPQIKLRWISYAGIPSLMKVLRIICGILPEHLSRRCQYLDCKQAQIPVIYNHIIPWTHVGVGRVPKALWAGEQLDGRGIKCLGLLRMWSFESGISLQTMRGRHSSMLYLN